MRRFNITGVCVPKKHYMVDISGKLAQITAMVDDGQYFTINRGRQYGKTTTLSRLEATLRDRYVVIRMSFEGVGDDGFSSDMDFVGLFVSKMYRELERLGETAEILDRWQKIISIENQGVVILECLGLGITELCKSLDKPVLLLIDEVDQSSDSQVFLNFLGLLRNKYLDAQEERDVTFHSVILAGVYDIKTLKLKLRPDAERKYNSPWNIAVNFDVDMSFSAEEIATMLRSYEEDAIRGWIFPG